MSPPRRTGPLAGALSTPNTCTQCSCCFGILVDVTGFDVHRLARSLALDPTAFVELCPSDETDDDIGAFFEPGAETYTLILRRREDDSALRDVHGAPCTFLIGPIGSPEGQFRCGVYEKRPSACRSYPAEIGRGRVRLRSIARCPAKTKLTDEAWRPHVRREQVEIDVHRIVVWRWNALVLNGEAPLQDDPPSAYLDWLVRLHDRLAEPWAALDEPELFERWGRYLDEGASPLLCPWDEVADLEPWRAPIERLLAIVRLDGERP